MFINLASKQFPTIYDDCPRITSALICAANVAVYHCYPYNLSILVNMYYVATGNLVYRYRNVHSITSTNTEVLLCQMTHLSNSLK